jgi:hypothetical protein
MADDPFETQNLPVSSRILHWLIRAYRRQLRIPLKQTPITKHLEKYCDVNHEIIRRILVGEPSDHHKKTFDNLLEYFRKAQRRLPDNCFEFDDYVDFLEAVSLIGVGNAQTDTFSFHLAGFDKRIADVETLLSGTFVSYRYAFEREEVRLVSREVLHIQRQSGVLEFQMSFCGHLDTPNQIAHRFTGNVVPVGASLCLIGFNTGNVSHDRARTLFLNNQPEASLSAYRFGILTSTRLRGELQPCSASTLLVRTAEPVADIDQFIQDVTCNEAFDTLIPR